MTERCKHCSEVIPEILETGVQEEFCCRGCETVFHILKSSNLHDYYKLFDQYSDQNQKQPSNQKKDYSYLNDPIYLQEEGFTDPNKMVFYLEGIHCVACLWLVENLPKMSDKVISSKVNMSLGTVEVVKKTDGGFGHIADLLHKIGYPAHPLKSESEREILVKNENKRWLMRLGVTAALSGNVMLMSFAIYSGADGSWERLFHYISLVLSLPVLIYGAYPFHQSAIAAMRMKRISIDTPISLALLMGTLISIVNVFVDSTHVYFDSLCSLVFLLLSSRYLLRRMNQKAMSSKRFLTNLTPRYAWRKLKESEEYERIPSSQIKSGNLLKVKSGGVFPTDGILESNTDRIDDSTFTGETKLKSFAKGDIVYGGYRNKGNELFLIATAEMSESRIGKILKEVQAQQNTNTETTEFADRIARWFVGLTLLLGAMILVLLWPEGKVAAFERFLSFIIIVCPCALALATPLSYSVGLNKALNSGVVFKSARALEKMSKVKTMFFDKTGTLTRGDMKVLGHRLVSSERDVLQIAYEMEQGSEHPIGKSILKYLSKSLKISNKNIVQEKKELAGVGPIAHIAKDRYIFKSVEISTETLENNEVMLQVGLYKNDDLLCVFDLVDYVTEEAIFSIRSILTEGVKVNILSGDIKDNVNRVARLFGLKEDHQFYSKTPEEKNEIVKSVENSAMVGDGANDALSLKSADVGVSVTGSLEVTTEASDVILTHGGSELAFKALIVAKETNKVIKRNFSISIAYNLFGGTLALMGYVTPLFAAVLMPLSSLTVVLSSVWATKRIREL